MDQRKVLQEPRGSSVLGLNQMELGCGGHRAPGVLLLSVSVIPDNHLNVQIQAK